MVGVFMTAYQGSLQTLLVFRPRRQKGGEVFSLLLVF